LINKNNSPQTTDISDIPQDVGTFFGKGDVVLRNVISERSTYIPRKNIFTINPKTLAVGEITIENHAQGKIYLSDGIFTCGKNIYPFTKIKGIIRGGTLNSFQVSLAISDEYQLNLEIRISNSERLFKKFNELKTLEINNFNHTLMRDQINFVKDRLGLHRV
tara:strand:- start:555 stop:1040 length:486 start_codon:yes stop_codon:yes gene_type:complete